MPYGTKILPYGKTLAILPNKKGGKCVNTHRPGMGPAPRDWVITILRPVRIPLPTGATALEIHEMNRHSRKNGGNVAKIRREGKAL